MSWFRKFSGKVSDAIPNEFSKLNSFTKFLPPPFSQIAQTPGAIDRFGETYSNEGSLADSFMHGASAYMGTSADPNKFSHKNYGAESDPWLTVGRVGDLIPSPTGSGGWNVPTDQYANLGQSFFKRNQASQPSQNINRIRQIQPRVINARVPY